MAARTRAHTPGSAGIESNTHARGVGGGGGVQGRCGRGRGARWEGGRRRVLREWNRACGGGLLAREARARGCVPRREQAPRDEGAARRAVVVRRLACPRAARPWLAGWWAGEGGEGGRRRQKEEGEAGREAGTQPGEAGRGH